MDPAISAAELKQYLTLQCMHTFGFGAGQLPCDFWWVEPQLLFETLVCSTHLARSAVLKLSNQFFIFHFVIAGSSS